MQFLKNQFLLTTILVVTLVWVGCDIFGSDGVSAEGVNPRKGYFYLIDRTSTSVIMLDNQLHELKRWNYLKATNDTSLQGIAHDGKYLWLASAGNTDRIFQVNATQDSFVVLKTYDAPPQRRGTVRGIASDGVNLWVLNNGSTTYNTPPYLYKMNPANGAVLDSFKLPSPEPRGITYVSSATDAYGRGPASGLYYTDVEKDKVYKFLPSVSFFDTAFSAPQPPLGSSYIYPTGLAFDGWDFWLVNSSNTADHLYRLSYAGKEQSRYDLPYPSAGEIVWSPFDIRQTEPLTITSLSPSSAVRGTSSTIEIFGTGFLPGAMQISFGDSITVNSVTVVDPTHLSVILTVSANADTGSRNISISQGGRSFVGNGLFRVTLVPVTQGYIWFADQSTPNTIYKLRVSDTTVTRQWTTAAISTGSAQGLAFDGNNIWLCAAGTDKKIYKLDTTGVTLTSPSVIAAPIGAGTMRGITCDNGSIWLAISAVSTTGRIYKLDPISGAVLDSVNSPGLEPRGIVMMNNELYCNDTSIDSVFAYNFTSHQWSSKFATPTPAGGTTSNRFATGLTWDGTNFWIANSTNNFDHIYKLSPAGIVLQTISAPNIGASQLTGLTYTPN